MENNYYQKNTERLQKESREIYLKISEEQKSKRQKKSGERCQDFTEEEKEK